MHLARQGGNLDILAISSGRDGYRYPSPKNEFKNLKTTRKLFSKFLRKIKRGVFCRFFFGKPKIGGLDLRLAVISFRWVVIYPRAQPPSREAHTLGKPFTNITRWTLLRFLTNLVSFFKCLFKSGRWQRDTLKDPCINTPFLGLKKRGLLHSSGMQNPRMLVVTTRIHLKKLMAQILKR